jgi:hypothetical protein
MSVLLIFLTHAELPVKPVHQNVLTRHMSTFLDARLMVNVSASLWQWLLNASLTTLLDTHPKTQVLHTVSMGLFLNCKYTGWFRPVVQYLRRFLGRSFGTENVNSFIQIRHHFRVITLLCWCYCIIVIVWRGFHAKCWPRYRQLKHS